MNTMAALVDRHLPSVELSAASLKTALPQVAKDPKQVACVADALREDAVAAPDGTGATPGT